MEGIWGKKKNGAAARCYCTITDKGRAVVRGSLDGLLGDGARGTRHERPVRERAILSRGRRPAQKASRQPFGPRAKQPAPQKGLFQFSRCNHVA